MNTTSVVEYGAAIHLKDLTETDKKQIMKMLHIEGEYSDFGINEMPIGVLKAMAHAIRYGRIQGAKTIAPT
ncbi:MAG: hypothetical protein NUV74_05240 [Candidatus Brocadiaceae bacterium]|nr:hypothetical protein [Candidatus Brocadiaceae bacterium]